MAGNLSALPDRKEASHAKAYKTQSFSNMLNTQYDVRTRIL